MEANIKTQATEADIQHVRNRVMGILTGIAIILVVLGHLDMNELSVFGLFPYYSFHVMVFVFISGYFYDPACEGSVTSYIGRKIRRLLVPYYICNLIYGVISTILNSYGFSYCSRISLFTLFIEPFLGGHQYGLNFAAWFVPALFLMELVNICVRRLLTLTRIDRLLAKTCVSKDVFMFIGTLILGIAVVALAQGGHVWGYYKTLGRILFMLPVYELGRVYKRHLEEWDLNVPDAWCIAIVCIAQFILYMLADGRLNFSAVWCTSFASLPFMPYLTTITGTWLWLRISRMFATTSAGAMLDRVGSFSFHIMTHHVAVFFGINLIMLAICNHMSVSCPFDTEAFMSDVVYTYLPSDMYVWKSVYLLASIAIPIAACKICGLLIKLFRTNV